MMERLSEPVGPTGSLQAEGIANILGRPPFDKLTLVLREAAQNIWDARQRDAGAAAPEMLVRLRTLSDDQRRMLNACLAPGPALDSEPGHLNELAKHLASSGPVRVLEIADFNTIGLVGKTDPREVTSNFVRFFFDVGAAHFKDGDGGTYGYGRSSLYLLGAARTIIVDSVPADSGESRRFMACRIGNSYEKRAMSGDVSRFTGRHFWGKRGEHGAISPVTGSDAARMAEGLGMPVRSSDRSGTTILIPWPEMDDEQPARKVVHALLENLWPKMVPNRGRVPMLFRVEIDGVPVPVPDPVNHPLYRLFSEALYAARSRSPDVAFAVRRGNQDLGHLGFAHRSRSQLGTSEFAAIDAAPGFPEGVHHVALMRPSELVVRYMPIVGLDENREWVGVFICSDEDGIRNAFAQSEPPAHDDWVPDRLEREDALIVKHALRRIQDLVRGQFSARIDRETAPLDTSLAGAADRFALRFLSGDGSGAAEEPGKGKPVTPQRPLPPVDFVELEIVNERMRARYRVRARKSAPRQVRGVPSVVIEGGGELPAGLDKPVVVRWIHPEGTESIGDKCVLESDGDYIVDVEFRGQYAIELNLVEDGP